MSEIAEALERYRRGAELVAVSVTGAAGSQLEYRPSPGAWCVKEILGHLVDAELLAAVRIRRILSEDNPQLLSYPQDAWTEKLGHRDQKLSDLMQMFRNLRADNHGLLKRQAPEAFDRIGTHNLSGPQTLLELVHGETQHTQGHVRQIQETRRLFKEQRDAG